MKKRNTHILKTLLLGSLVTISTVAVGLGDNPGMKELENNSEYVALKQRSKQLSLKADSINTLLMERRTMMNEAGDTDIEALRVEIINLEQQAHDISVEQGTVTRQIGAMEQSVIMDQILSNQQHVVVGEVIDDSIDDTASQGVANLIDNECFKLELDAKDYEDLRNAQALESEMIKLVDEYTATYNQLVQVAEEYGKADRASVANPLYKKYEELTAKLQTLNDEMLSKWNHILDTKYFAMAYILEKSHRYDILDRAAFNYQTMQQKCAEQDGQFASDGLMRYAIGRSTLLSYEIEFARDMRLKPAQDSLRNVQSAYKQPYYSIHPVKVEYREYMDFAPVKIGRTNFYDDNTNPIPKLQIFDKGTIYRIRLGKFRTKQTMTLFKGVQPMSIERDSEGMYCYYAGGYAQQSEAVEALQFLKDKGFKNPELCCWKDGKMSVVATEKAKSTKATDSKVRYMVIINAQNLDNTMRQLITRIAPGKMVSRSGNTYAVGMFADYGEADNLLTTLTEAYPTLEMGISETEIE